MVLVDVPELDVLRKPDSLNSFSEELVLLGPSGDPRGRDSSDEADMALTCAMTICAFSASSSSSRMRSFRHWALFSASIARFSDADIVRFTPVVVSSESDLSLLAWRCWIRSLTRCSASSASSRRACSFDMGPGLALFTF